jgi:hypothetical protein
MFPELNNDSLFNDSSSFFGTDEVPEYDNIFISGNDDLKMLSNSIRNINEDCCGYIAPINIFYHTMDEKQYFINFNRSFVFAYIKDEDFPDHLPYGFLMKFLQYKCKKMLLVYEDNCFLLEKTEDTYKVCAELEKIYENSDFFYENIIKKVPSKRILADCFINLIKEYKSKIGMSEYKEIDDFDLLIKFLKLNIE